MTGFSSDSPMSLVIRAARYAAQAHQGQTRQKGEPYHNHLNRVAFGVALLPDSTEEMVAAAYLHDILEDTKVTEAELRSHFGETVTALVLELTNCYSHQQHPELSREVRKDLELGRLVRASKEAQRIKLLDRIDNLSDGPFLDDDGTDYRTYYLPESEKMAHELGKVDANLQYRLLETIQKANSFGHEDKK